MGHGVEGADLGLELDDAGEHHHSVQKALLYPHDLVDESVNVLHWVHAIADAVVVGNE